MKPTNFPNANKVLKATPGQEGEVIDLHVWSDGQHCVSCWKMSWRDRIRVLFTGTVWFWAMGRTHPPVLLEAESPQWAPVNSEEAA
jgi:hypothetical protein